MDSDLRGGKSARLWLVVCVLLLAACAGCRLKEDLPGSAAGVAENPRLSMEECRSALTLREAREEYVLKAHSGRAMLVVTVANASRAVWPHAGGRRVSLGFLWYGPGKTDFDYAPNFGEGRTGLPDIVLPGDSVDLEVLLGPMGTPGEYEVWIGPVQESVTWFWQAGDTPIKVRVRVEE